MNNGFIQDIERLCNKCGATVVVRVVGRFGQSSHAGHSVQCPTPDCGERLPGEFPGSAVADVFVVED